MFPDIVTCPLEGKAPLHPCREILGCDHVSKGAWERGSGGKLLSYPFTYCFSCRDEPMAGPTTHAAPMLFLALLALLELSLAGSLGPGTSARNLPENHIGLPGPALRMSQAGHHRRRGLGKKEQGPGMPGWAQDGTAVTSTRQAPRLPGAGAPLPGKSPAGLLLQDKGLPLGLALPSPGKENRSPGSERVKKRGSEHKRRRERLKLHRGSWRSGRGWAPAMGEAGVGWARGEARGTSGAGWAGASMV